MYIKVKNGEWEVKKDKMTYIQKSKKSMTSEETPEKNWEGIMFKK